MRLRAALAVFAMIAAGLLLSACAGTTYVLRYRLTLVVDVDGELNSGSSVIEASYRDQEALAGLAQGMPWGFGWRGEATMVDLGSRRILFCLLKRDETRPGSPDNPASLPLVYFPSFGVGLETGNQGVAHLKNLIRDKPRAEISLAQLPMLVRFRDISDPKTVERVDPLDLAASFGPGVKLVRATIEITDDPITAVIESKLSWLSLLRSKRASLDGDTSIARPVHAPLSNILGTGYFKTGD